LVASGTGAAKDEAVAVALAMVWLPVLAAAPDLAVVLEQLAGTMAMTAAVIEVTMLAAIPIVPPQATVRPIVNVEKPTERTLAPFFLSHYWPTVTISYS
jgi:hypothetical protein